MKSKNTKPIKISIITAIALIIVTIIIVAVIMVRTNKNATQEAQIQTTQSTASTPTQESTIQPAAAEPTSPSSIPLPLPKQPSFTKSSGNNGPIAVGANMNFICSAQAGIDCSIILISGSKQIVLGPTKVTDNGRGQYFASFYWTAVKGTYKVTAEAKNIQGGASGSITQALEVQ
jgi:hypothetical protein